MFAHLGRATALSTSDPMIPVLEREPRVLGTSVATLDSFIGGFNASQVTLIDSAHRMVNDLVHMLCVDQVAQDGQVVWIDGGNVVNPYQMTALCKRYRIDPRYALEQVSISRAFTAYQLSTLIDERAEERISNVGAGTLIITSMLDMYQDKDMWWSESSKLIDRALSSIRRLTEEYDLVTVVTNRGLRKMSFKRGLKEVMYGGADKVLRIEGGSKAMRLNLVNEGRMMDYHPVPWFQTTIEEFMG